MTSLFEQRRRDQQALDDAEYRRCTAVEDEGHDDGYAGRPDRTAEMGEYSRYYGGGFEQGAAERATELGS